MPPFVYVVRKWIDTLQQGDIIMNTSAAITTGEHAYLNLLEQVLRAPVRGDRTGTGTRSIFGHQMRFDLTGGFPLITTKKVWLRGIFHELKWMLMGDTNIKYLVDNGVNIWNDWPLKHYNAQRLEDQEPATMEQFIEAIKTSPDFAKRWGECGPVYGYQWRKWPHAKISTMQRDREGWGSFDERVIEEETTIDQIADVLNALRTTPESRRMIVNAWNVADIPEMIPSGLPPCHMMMQFYTRPKVGSVKRYLDCQVYLRSNDLLLGAPFNIAQYALLTHLMANCVGMFPGELVYTIGDAHIYLNHVEQVEEQLKRQPYLPPELIVQVKRNDPAEYEWNDISLIDYQSHPPLRGDIAV